MGAIISYFFSEANPTEVTAEQKSAGSSPVASGSPNLDKEPNTPQDIPQDIPQDTSQDIPQDTSQDIPQDIPQDTSHNTSQNAPQDTPQNTPRIERVLSVFIETDNLEDVEKINILVKCANKEVNVGMFPLEKISYLLKQACEEFSKKQDKMCLILEGEQLDPQKTISDYPKLKRKLVMLIYKS